MIKPGLSYFDYASIIKNEKYANQKLAIRDLTFQVTEDCNLKCSYCYQGNKTHNKMNFATAKKFIDYLFENKNNPDFFYNEERTLGFVIEFIGGEPFLEVDLISEIIDYFEYKFLQYPDSSWLLYHAYNFSTNGTLYNTPKVQEFLKKYREIIHMGITVDGNKQLHDSCRLFPDGSGSYNLAIEAALAELSNGYESTKITISPNNVNFIFDGISNMISLGFKHININCCFENLWDNESSIALFHQLIKVSDWIIENELYDKIYIAMLDYNRFSYPTDYDFETNWCGVGEGGMAILDYKGNLYPCLRFMPSSLGNDIEPILIGDLDNGLFVLEEHKKNRDKLNNCTRKNLSNKECLECPISAGCAWCLGYCYQETGGLNEKTNHICKPYKLEALATKYLSKIANDEKAYDSINISYEMYKDLLTEEEYNYYI